MRLGGGYLLLILADEDDVLSHSIVLKARRLWTLCLLRLTLNKHQTIAHLLQHLVIHSFWTYQHADEVDFVMWWHDIFFLQQQGIVKYFLYLRLHRRLPVVIGRRRIEIEHGVAKLQHVR
jgi:hypothetical protein